MKKSDFEEIQKNYLEERARFMGIKPGDLVWEAVARGGMDMDYHPAVVKRVNVDETYIDVVDVTRGNQEMRYESFFTESELVKTEGFSIKTIEEERKEYSKIIKKVLKQNKRPLLLRLINSH